MGGRTSLDENPDRKGVVKSQFPDNGNKHGPGVPCAPKGGFVEKNGTRWGVKPSMLNASTAALHLIGESNAPYLR